ncbi:muscarinic acetylcholine receptor M1-like [Lampetra fluviatilis]
MHFPNSTTTWTVHQLNSTHAAAFLYPRRDLTNATSSVSSNSSPWDNSTRGGEAVPDPHLLDPLGGHSVLEVVGIGLFTGVMSLATIVGNVLVLVSFKVNKQLHTVNNYYLLSLAVADLIIGIFSMNLFTCYMIMGHWALGSLACDLWLALDYVASNASVMNLLVISFDRFFSITRPLTYRAKRTPHRAALLIGLAWVVSFVLWAPAILFWQYIVGERTVPPDECRIQFLSEPIITFCTAIAAFYLPVTIMATIYWRIFKEIQNRARDLAMLQGSISEGREELEQEEDMVEVEDEKEEEEEESTQAVDTPQVSGERRRVGNNSSSKDNGATSASSHYSEKDDAPKKHRAIYSMVMVLPSGRCSTMQASKVTGRLTAQNADMRDPMRDSMPSHEVRIRSVRSHNFSDRSGQTDGASPSLRQTASERSPVESDTSEHSSTSGTREVCAASSSSTRISMRDLSTAKRFTSAALKVNVTARKRMSLIKEKKAARTLSAILLAFIITWTPYNIMVLMSTFCPDCVPPVLWNIGYWLCYVNSTVNPVCYALCNRIFRKTFRQLLLCQLRNSGTQWLSRGLKCSTTEIRRSQINPT